jgi:hypothetical protein
VSALPSTVLSRNGGSGLAEAGSHNEHDDGSKATGCKAMAAAAVMGGPSHPYPLGKTTQSLRFIIFIAILSKIWQLNLVCRGFQKFLGPPPVATIVGMERSGESFGCGSGEASGDSAITSHADGWRESATWVMAMVIWLKRTPWVGLQAARDT